MENTKDPLDDDTFNLATFYEPLPELVCPKGDVVLRVDDKFHPVRRLRVSTCILAQIVPFFHKLFAGKFLESQCNARDTTAPNEIELNENPGAVHMLCYILHHEPIEDVMNIKPSTLLDYAILNDKYDCVDQLAVMNEGLLQAQFQAQKDRGWCISVDDDLLNLTAAAYILDAPIAFRRATKKYVDCSWGNLQMKDFNVKAQPFIPMTLIESLNAQANAAKQVLSHHIGEMIATFSKAAQIRGKQDHLCTFLDSLSSAQVYPIKADPMFRGSVHGQLFALEHFVNIPILLSNAELCSCGRQTSATLTAIHKARDGTYHVPK